MFHILVVWISPGYNLLDILPWILSPSTPFLQPHNTHTLQVLMQHTEKGNTETVCFTHPLTLMTHQRNFGRDAP